MRTKKIILNTIFSLLEEIIAIICAFILPRLILAYFGSKYNGLITSISQFLACAVLLRSGIGGATRAVLYKPLAKNDQSKVNSIVKATDIFMKKIGLILLLIILGFSFIYAFFINTEFDWIFTVTLFIIIGLSTFAESFFGITYLIILQADQNLWISSLIKSICYILNVIIASLLIVSGCGIHLVKIGSAVAFCFSPVVLNIYVKKRYNINLKEVEPDNSAISQRWDAFWHQVAIFVNTNTDVMILTIFTNMLEVSVYSIYNLVISGLKRFIVSFTNGFEGMFGNMLAKDENDNLKKNLLLIELVVNSIATIIYSAAVVMVLQFVKIYTNGITDVDYFRPFFAYILLFAGMNYAIRLPYQFIIQAAGHFKQTKKYAIIEAILNIVLSIILVIKYGLIGVATGTIVSTTYKTLMYIDYMSKNIIKRSRKIIIKKVLLSYIESFIIIIIMKLIKLPLYTNYWNFILNGIITLIVSIIIVGLGILIFYKKDFNDLLYKLKYLKKRKKGV